jgi:hypothetical protein
MTSQRDKSAGYLRFLKGPPIKSEGDGAPDWYANMSNGLHALNAERDAQRDLMVAMLANRSARSSR